MNSDKPTPINDAQASHSSLFIPDHGAPADASYLIGKTVNGRTGKYIILEHIARSGMSDVYKARIETTFHEDALNSITTKFVGRVVACKVLLSRLLDDKEHYQRFQQQDLRF